MGVTRSSALVFFLNRCTGVTKLQSNRARLQILRSDVTAPRLLLFSVTLYPAPTYNAFSTLGPPVARVLVEVDKRHQNEYRLQYRRVTK